MATASKREKLGDYGLGDAITLDIPQILTEMGWRILGGEVDM
jgi:hypothetical protein